MTSAQRIALAVAFERLQARIAAQPATLPPHPVIERRKPIVVKARIVPTQDDSQRRIKNAGAASTAPARRTQPTERRRYSDYSTHHETENAMDKTKKLAKKDIDNLIARRNLLTSRRDGWVNWEAVNRIDAKLQTVEAGKCNDVDAALGRTGAQLPERAEYQLRPSTDTAAATEAVAELAQAKMSEFEAHMRMLCADTEPEAPDYPGMWK